METNTRYILVADDNRAIHQDIQKIITYQKNSNQNQLIDSTEALLFGENLKGTHTTNLLYDLIIDSAFQCDEAIELVTKAAHESRHYSLAFIDMRMPPGSDGLECIKKIWAIDPEIQVIISTAYSDYTYDELYSQLKAVENFLILKKPFDMIEVLQMIAALIKKWDLNKSVQNQIQNLEKLVKARSDELVHNAKMATIGQLAAGVAHEINNPIGYVMSNNTVLKKYVSSISEAYKQYESFLERIKPETNEELFLAKTELLAFCKSKKIDAILTDTNNLLEESHEGLERVKNIVMDLKTYSHAGTANLEEVNIIDSIESCLKIINNEIRYKCTVKKNWSKLPVLWGYPSQLHQVFLNILVNAAQSITEKGEISITIESNNDEIIVIIKDTGEGISPEHLEKLFEPFFTTKAVGVGTGLGLSISNNIIKKHKGTIEVESCVGKGTAFKISLPINGLKNSTGMNHAQQK